MYDSSIGRKGGGGSYAITVDSSGWVAEADRKERSERMGGFVRWLCLWSSWLWQLEGMDD